VEILAWLVPSALVTVVAMLWVAWAGRPQRQPTERSSDAAYERFARAITREHPAAGRPPTLVARDRDRSTGIAVRPSRRTPDPAPPTRRSA
jgi:hypothetical protein